MNQAANSDADDAKKRTSLRIWRALRVAGFLVALPVLFFTVGVFLLFDREITAPSWLKNRVSQNAETVLAGGTLEFGEIVLNVGRDLHPRIVLSDAQMRDAEGVLIAKVDRVKGLVSPRGVLFERTALLQDIEIEGVSISLERDTSGQFSVSFEQSDEIRPKTSDLNGLMRQLDEVFAQPATAALEKIKLRNLTITFHDRLTGQDWHANEGSAGLTFLNGEIRAQSEIFVRQPTGTDASISAQFSRQQGQNKTEINLSIENANAADVATLSPALSWLGAVDAPLNAILATGLDDEGVATPLIGALTLGAGKLQPSDNETGLPFQSAQVSIVYEQKVGRINFESVELQSDWLSLVAEGQAHLHDIENGLPGSIVTQLNLRDVSVNPPGFFDHPQFIQNAVVDFRLFPDPFTIDIGQATVTDEDFPVQFSGGFSIRNGGWAGGLDFTSPAVEQDLLLSWWPNGMKPKSRDWFRNNLLSGALTDVAGGIRITSELPIDYAIGFEFRDTTVRILKELPPIERAEGFATFVNNAFDLSLSNGELTAPMDGTLDFSGSSFRIHDLRMKPSPMDLNFEVSSSVTSALSVLDLPPFEFMQKANLPVDVAQGRSDIYGTLTFPLKYGLKGEEVDVDMQAELRRVSSDILIEDEFFAADQLQLTVTNEELQILGLATVNESIFGGVYRQVFGDGGTRELTANIELSQQFLDSFGIALPPGSVRGRSPGQLDVRLQEGLPPSFELTSNMRGLGVSIPAIGWVKPPASNGELIISGALSSPIRVDRLDISANSLSAKGAVVLNADNSLNLAQFHSVHVGDWFDAPVSIRGRGNERPVSIELRGGQIDLRNAQLGASGSQSPPMSINLDRLQIADGLALTNLAGEFGGSNGLSGQFQALVNGSAHVRGTIVPQDGRSAIRLVSEDAGAVVTAAGYLKNAHSGTLDLTLQPVGEAGDYDGNLLIRGLRVREAPAIAELLNAVSVVGLLQQLDGQGLAFDEVDARFRLSSDRIVVSQSSATGPGLGISLDGVYTLASKTVDFQGVISPVYLLNGIGSILTRKGEGLIGFNFNLTGFADSPNVTVNPLSALTPGMFREIFRQPAPQVSQ